MSDAPKEPADPAFDITPMEIPRLRPDLVDRLRALAELGAQLQAVPAAAARVVGATGAWDQRTAQSLDADLRILVRRYMTRLSDLPLT